MDVSYVREDYMKLSNIHTIPEILLTLCYMKAKIKRIIDGIIKEERQRQVELCLPKAIQY